MLLCILFAVLVSVSSEDLPQPKFQVLTPNQVMVEVPSYEDRQLLIFRIGVRRAGSDADDLELGENDIDNNKVFIYDQRLNLKEGDVVNYILVWKATRGYQTQSGNYTFNGVYYKKPYGRRLRFRRDVDFPATTEQSTATNFAQDSEEETTEEFNPDAPSIESRFGHRHHHRGNWGNQGFNPFGHQRRGPPPSVYPPPFGYQPNFGRDCNNQFHDSYHGHGNKGNERWRETTMQTQTGEDYQGHSMEYHCKICDSLRGRSSTEEIITRKTSTTTEYQPDIDIRFLD